MVTMRWSWTEMFLGGVDQDDRDLGLLHGGRGAQRGVVVGALLEVDALADARRVDDFQTTPPSSISSSTGSRVCPRSR